MGGRGSRRAAPTGISSVPVGSQRIRCSVVVTVLNDAPGVTALVDALAGQTRLPDEIIIVDGGSTDGTCECLVGLRAGDVPLRRVRLEGANIAQGRNHGISLAHHDIIACTDAGSVPEPDWLEHLLRPFEDPDMSVVGGSYRIDPRTRLERVAGLLTMPGQLAPVDPTRFNPSARSIAFRVSAWRNAGGFPDWLYTAEDTLFDCKLRRNAEVFAHAERAVVRWRPRRSLAAVWRQFRNYARGESQIGRGHETASYWERRYALAACVLASSVVTWACAVAALVLLLGPVHRRAMVVARHTRRPLDYLSALFLGHWVALATTVGFRLGSRDRIRQPDVFVTRLRGYWGADSVGDVPSWRMKDPPAPRTLVVSWHWPPTNRASTNVIANLFQVAPHDAFRVLTRGMKTPGDDPLPRPELPTCEVPWPRKDDCEIRYWTWLASIVTTARMLLAAQRLHREWPIRRVLAVYPHRYGLLAGWLAARVLGVPFAAWMHDLFAETSITSSYIKRTFWSRIDRAALGSAQLVIVPTLQFAEHYARRGVRRTWVLPHCRPAGVPESEAPLANGRLRLLYAGSVYQAHEDAVVALAKAVEGLPDVKLSFLTHRNRALPDDQVRWGTRAQAFEWMRKSDVLVVALGFDTPYPLEIHGCFPSKLADYLAVGRPILAVVPPDCFVDQLVRESGCGVVATSLAPQIIVQAIDALRDPQARRRMAQAARGLSAQFDPHRLAQLLCQRLAQGASVDAAGEAHPTGSQHSAPNTQHLVGASA